MFQEVFYFSSHELTTVCFKSLQSSYATLEQTLCIAMNDGVLDILLQNERFLWYNIHQRSYCRGDIKHKISVANTPREFVFHGMKAVYFYKACFL